MSKKFSFCETPPEDQVNLYFHAATGQGTEEQIQDVLQYAARHSKLIFRRIALTYLRVVDAPERPMEVKAVE